jgi:hypothetical protein
MTKKMNWQYFIIFFIGLIIPLLSIYALHSHHIDTLTLGEPGKYIPAAKGLFHIGQLMHLSHGHYVPELERLPGYPFFIFINYTLFGLNHYTAITLIQSLLMGSIVLAIALTVRIILPNLMWPAAILAAICPNLAFRAAMIMPDLLFAFFVSWGLFFLIKSIYHQHTLRLLSIATLFFTLALYTRPAFLLYPIFTLPAIIYLLKSRLHYSLLKSCLYSLSCLTLMIVFISPQLFRIHHYTGHYTLTTQGPNHALFWIYPCLSSKWGGKRDISSLKIAKTAQQKLIMRLPKQQQNNPGIRYNINKQLTKQLISGIPASRLMTASIGSSLKLMFYTAFISIMETFKIKPIKLTTHVTSMIQQAFSSGWAFMLLMSQSLLFISRILQLCGIIYGLSVSRFRALTTYLLTGSLSFVAISISIGNPRYRSPMEPILILFSILGIEAIKHYRQNHRR